MGRTARDARLGELMRGAQAGDAEAYVMLLREIAPRLRRIIARRRGTRGAADVEDLVQDVLLSVHVARASYDAGRPFQPWLLAIVRNRLADAARRYVRHAAHEVQVERLDVTFPDRRANPSLEARFAVRALHRAVEGLPRGQREAIRLLKLDGLSLKEAAAATGMTVGALKVATHRAVATLRRVLAGL